MLNWIPYLLAGAVILLAGAVIFSRVRAFFRTKGMSACRHCPYAGNCPGRDGRKRPQGKNCRKRP